MTTFTNFADLASFVADERRNDALTQTYEGAFIEHSEMAKLSVVDAPEQLDMPDPEQVRAAVEMMMATMFDVLRDTRMEPFAADLAWGFANSFHVVAKRIEGREDDAANKLRDLARAFDPSEIYATELEETQTLCQTLQGCREAMECSTVPDVSNSITACDRHSAAQVASVRAVLRGVMVSENSLVSGRYTPMVKIFGVERLGSTWHS